MKPRSFKRNSTRRTRFTRKTNKRRKNKSNKKTKKYGKTVGGESSSPDYSETLKKMAQVAKMALKDAKKEAKLSLDEATQKVISTHTNEPKLTEKEGFTDSSRYMEAMESYGSSGSGAIRGASITPAQTAKAFI